MEVRDNVSFANESEHVDGGDTEVRVLVSGK